MEMMAIRRRRKLPAGLTATTVAGTTRCSCRNTRAFSNRSGEHLPRQQHSVAMIPPPTLLTVVTHQHHYEKQKYQSSKAPQTDRTNIRICLESEIFHTFYVDTNLSIFELAATVGVRRPDTQSKY